jgi:hypothetical protein
MTRGESLIFAAWIGIFGGFLVPRVLGFLTSDLDSVVTVTGIGTGLSVIGAVFLVVLIWWIEGRILKRRQEQLAAAGDASAPGEAEVVAPVAEPSATPVVPDVVQTRSAFAAAPSLSASPVLLEEPAMGPPAEPVPDAPSPAEPGPPQPLAAAVERPTEPARAPARVEPAPAEAQPAPPGPAPDVASTRDPAPPAVPTGAPNLTIRVSSRGMMTAEMDGQSEHVMLDDLGAYAEALSHVGGMATIVVPSDDGMPGLIAKRAQRILEDAGVTVTLA